MKNLFAGKKLVERWKIWFTIPIVIIVIATLVFAITAGVSKDAGEGIKLGIDFTGGSVVNITIGDKGAEVDKAEQTKIEAILKEKGVNFSDVQFAGDGEGRSLVYRYKLVSTELNTEVETALNDIYGSDNVNLQFIGATASSNLILTAVLSILISTILILLYIIIRFRNLATAFAAIIALLHDVLMVFALTIICRIQINAAFIAAVITIVAYSINNTIVIFDRIRFNQNNRDKSKALNYERIANVSVAQTLSRSINTSITTLVAIVILAIIGVSSIREFALPVIFGLLAGTFSSIFIAPSLFCQFKSLGAKMKDNKGNKTPKIDKKARKTQAVAEIATTEE